MATTFTVLSLAIITGAVVYTHWDQPLQELQGDFTAGELVPEKNGVPAAEIAQEELGGTKDVASAKSQAEQFIHESYGSFHNRNRLGLHTPGLPKAQKKTWQDLVPRRPNLGNAGGIATDYAAPVSWAAAGPPPPCASLGLCGH